MSDADTPSISLLEQAKLVAERLKRNKNEMKGLESVIELKASRLKACIKIRDDASSDVVRITTELEALTDRRAKLSAWLVKNGDTQQDVDKVALMAEKIKRLRAQMERLQREMRDAEAEAAS